MTNTAVPTSSLHHEGPPIWRNTTILKWGVQIIVLVLTIAAFWFLWSQAVTNLRQKGVPISYGWMQDPAGFQLGEGIDTKPKNMGRALWAGMVNTLRIAGAGIIASTILGVVVGIARLSNNWLVNKIASIFVESLRNIPVLVQILLWYVILASLPKLSEDSITAWGLVIPSQRGISIPHLSYGDGFYQFLVTFAVLAIPLWFVQRVLIRKRDNDAGSLPVGWITFAMVTLAALIAWFANGVTAPVGRLFHGIETAWDSIPQIVMQALLAALSVGGAALFIKRFLDSRRSGGKLAKLSDDDYFNMIFAGVAGLIGAFIALKMWPGLGSWLVNSGADFWGWLGDKFGGGRGTTPLTFSMPSLTDGKFAAYAPTGLTMTVSFAALFFGLVFYTASFIAEIVRGGIQAVAKGQSEAAAALGLSRGQALRKVILPQAFRIIMPPLGNQYLNITKNTSLGIAVAYADVVQVGQTIYNKNSQSLAMFSIYMIFFLVLSLLISFVVNTINNKLKLVER